MITYQKPIIITHDIPESDSFYRRCDGL